MQYVTYIIYSETIEKYYVGYTGDFNKRLEEHNRGKSKYTCRGIPWKEVKVFKLDSKQEAIRLENEIKKRGCKRFLEGLE